MNATRTTAERHFPPDPSSVAGARAFTREFFHDEEDHVLEVLELLASELATNAVLHAGTAFVLRASQERGIRVEVEDFGGGKARLKLRADRAPTGRGLRLVEALADRWGVEPRTGGKTVWFELDSGAGA